MADAGDFCRGPSMRALLRWREWCFIAPVPNSPASPGAPRLTRRGALAGFGAMGAALALAGCTAKQIRSTPQIIAADPIGPLYTDTQTLLSSYDEALATSPELAPLLGALREETRQHLVALASLIGLAAPAVSPGPDTSGSTTAPPANPTPVASNGPSPAPGSIPSTTAAATPTGPTAGSRATLADAEQKAQDNAVAACLTAPAGRVAVLASIAACRATHVAVLR
jgi:hypothetical protein